MASVFATLTGTGTFIAVYLCVSCELLYSSTLFYTQFPLLRSPYHHLVPYKELWWVVLKLSIVQ